MIGDANSFHARRTARSTSSVQSPKSWSPSSGSIRRLQEVRGGEPCSRRHQVGEPKGGSPSVSRETFVLLPQDVSRETSVLCGQCS